MTDSRRYKAFISYSHSDEQWARWLQRSLERYRLPKSLLEKNPELPKRLFPVFRDRDELASGGDLSDSIRQAMDDSEALVVICSPAARNSRWVNEEIRRFRASGRGDRIFCLLVAGSPEPGAPDCAFPPALILGDNGEVLHEPLAADATPKGDGKRNAMLKIAAGLLHVGVDELKRRDAQRQARFWSFVAAGSLLIASLTIGLAIYAFNAKTESEIRRQQAEGLIGFMLGDLREKLEPIGKLDILDSVGNQAMKYFATLGDRGSPKELLARGKALHQIGEVRKTKGDLESAHQAFKESLKQMQALHKADPSNNDNLFELGQAEFWVGYVAWERGDLQGAEKPFINYMKYSRELLAREPENSDYNMELSYAYSNIGSLARARGNSQLALDNFILSRDINAEELKKHPNDIELTYALAEAWSWIGSTKMDLGDITGSDQAFDEISKLLLPIYEKGDNARATYTLAVNMDFQTDVKLALGDIDSAKDINSKSLQILSMLTNKDPNNADWLVALHKSKLSELEMTPGGKWTAADNAEINQLLEDSMALAAKDSTSSRNKRVVARILREKARRALQDGNPVDAAASAGSAYAYLKDLLKENERSPSLYVEFAKSAEILGIARMANGQSDDAQLIWQDAASLLDRQTVRIFDFYPVRHLLAINLKQTEKAKEIEKELIKAGFRDPRMESAYNLTSSLQ